MVPDDPFHEPPDPPRGRTPRPHLPSILQPSPGLPPLGDDLPTPPPLPGARAAYFSRGSSRASSRARSVSAERSQRVDLTDVSPPSLSVPVTTIGTPPASADSERAGRDGWRRIDEQPSPLRTDSPVRKPSKHAHFNLAALPSIATAAPAAGSTSSPATATGTGSGTPQRVQFNPDHIITVAPADDEADNDHANGDAAKEDRAAEDQHRYENRPHDAPDLAHVNSALENYSRSGAQYPRVPSALSLDSMLPSEEDYDYRLDKDPLPPDEDEHNGTPAEERRNESSRLHALLDSAAAEHVHGGYVQLGETDGLPSRPGTEAHEDLRTATNIVRSHTGRWGQLRQRVQSGSVRRKGTGTANGTTATTTTTGKTTATDHTPEVDVEKQTFDTHTEDVNELGRVTSPAVPVNGPLNAPPGVSGNSVLSSLLALYNNQQQAADSTTTSAVTTPQSSRPPSIADSDDLSTGLNTGTPKDNRWFWQRGRHTPPAPPNTGDGSSGMSEKHLRTKSQTSIMDREERPGGIFGALARHVEEVRDDRPKSARNAAGVFGALVQNTAGMAAVAVPSASTLMPAAKRPGYHLTRYSLAEEPPSPRFKPPSRSGSSAALHRPSSGPATPTGIHSHPSSTVGLNMMRDEFEYGVPSRPTSMYSSSTLEKGDSHLTDMSKGDTLREARSSDNLLMMKGKKKKSVPNPLNLKAVKSAEGWLTGRSVDDLQGLSEEEKRRRQLAHEKRKRKKAREARKKQEVFIIRHVAAIITRQQFILKLARALMMFGSPTHRIETQIQATAKVLDISAQVVYLPNIMLVSFADETMHTSETKFLKQTSTLDLGKLLATHNLYWEVVHDRMSVEDANQELDYLMTVRPLYRWWQMVIIGAFCSAIIVIPSYYGSFLDALMAAPLGMLLIVVQTFAAKNDLFSGVFEITIATFISFLAAALGDTRYFCYTALVSGGIVMILPGYIVLTGALEIASRNITAGAVRMGYSVIYSLFLGFGISMGAEIYMKIRNKDYVTNATDYTCSATHYAGAPWYMQTPSGYWYYLCVPAFSFFLSLSNQQPIFRKETPIMMALACAGWVTNHFVGRVFTGRSDIVSAIGSFCVGLLGNIYGRFFSNGASFPVMVTGILMQLPSGLKEGGLFNFAANTEQGAFTQYSSGFSVAAQLISVAIGLTVGLFCAAVITNPLGGSRRRGAGIFSF